MEFKVKEVTKEEKSRVEVENELLKKHEEKFEDSGEEKVDVDKDQALSAQYGIRNIPTIIKVSTGGKLVGNQTAEAIRALYNYGD